MSWQERLKAGVPLVDIHLFDVGGTKISVATVITFLLICAATIVISRVLRRGMRRVLVSRGVTDEGTVGVAARLLHYTILAVGLGVGLHTIGINLTALFAAGAVFAVGLGFAMQNMTANFVSGVILLMERSIKPGDVLEVEGQLIRVRDMGIRATVARTLDEEDLLIPNSNLVQSTVKNYTFRDSLFRLRTAVGVVYGSDMALVRRVLEETAGGLAWPTKQRAPRILLTDFGDSSVNWEISVWIEEPWSMRQRRSELNEALWWALKEAGVVIAFPQLDVHFDAPVVESLEGLRRAV